MKKLQPAIIEQGVLDKLHAKTPQKQRDSWGYTRGYAGKFKSGITEQLLRNQSRRCAYCGSRLRGEHPHRDHIAPKESHPEFTFLPSNLVLACYYCNTECKGAYDSVDGKAAAYSKCTFRIVHPYLDEPSEHIEFVGGEKEILIRVTNDSAKGRETIRLFKLTSPEISKQRAKDALFDEDLEHLPGPWQGALEDALQMKLAPKV